MKRAVLYIDRRHGKHTTMNGYRITFEDGNTIVTDFNGTLRDAERYYIGQAFNFGDTDEHPKDKMVKAIKVEML